MSVLNQLGQARVFQCSKPEYVCLRVRGRFDDNPYLWRQPVLLSTEGMVRDYLKLKDLFVRNSYFPVGNEYNYVHPLIKGDTITIYDTKFGNVDSEGVKRDFLRDFLSGDHSFISRSSPLIFRETFDSIRGYKTGLSIFHYDGNDPDLTYRGPGIYPPKNVGFLIEARLPVWQFNDWVDDSSLAGRFKLV